MKQPRFKTGDRVWVTNSHTSGIVVSSVEMDDSTIPELNGVLIYKVYSPEFKRVVDGYLEDALEEPARRSER